MKQNTFRFRTFPVYKDTLVFISEVKQFTKSAFPKNEQFGLTSQLWRALDSIILNIAEGTDKYSHFDFSRFLNQALGSLNEVVACFDIALLNKYLSKANHSEFLEKADKLYRQLKAFSSYVRKNSKSS
jgi:four helix bundle protein